MLGTCAGVWWLLSGVAHVIWEREPWTVEKALLSVRVIANVAGAALCVFATMTAGRNKGLAVLVSGAPFTVAGVLLLASSGRANAPGS